MKSIPCLLASVSLLMLACVVTNLVHAQGETEPIATSSSATKVARSGSSDETVTALTAQVAEMRRSEDRLLSTVQLALGTVFSIAIGLAVFSWFSANKLFQRDLTHMKEEIHTLLRADINGMFTEANLRFKSSHLEMRNQLHEEMIAYTLGHVADLRLRTGDVAGSIDAAFEQVSSAKRGNQNYEAHALEKLSTAFKAALSQGMTIDIPRIQSARRVISESQFDERANALASTLDALVNKRP